MEAICVRPWGEYLCSFLHLFWGFMACGTVSTCEPLPLHGASAYLLTQHGPVFGLGTLSPNVSTGMEDASVLAGQRWI